MSAGEGLGVVIPTYNEAETIGDLLKRIERAVPAAHILVVDDSPGDETEAAVTSSGNPQATCLRRNAKRGRGTAVIEGMGRLLDTGADVIADMDADLSHPPEMLPAMLTERTRRDFDILIASRYVAGGSVSGFPVQRRFLSRTANRIARALLHLPLHDFTSSFRLYSRPAAETIVAQSRDDLSGFIKLSEMLVEAAFAGHTIGETPLVFHHRHRAGGSVGPAELWNAGIGMLKLAEIRRRRLTAALDVDQGGPDNGKTVSRTAR